MKEEEFGMKERTTLLLALQIFLSTLATLNPVVCTAEERKVFDRNYVGLGVEAYALNQCYRGDTVTVMVSVEALEDVRNVSVNLIIWGSKSEGYTPWGTSFNVLDIADFPSGTIEEEAYNITMPLDIDPGLIYGILFLDWTIYKTSFWEDQWDKASFRVTYVKDKDYEDLQTSHNSVLNELRNVRIVTYVLLAATIALAASTAYLARAKKVRRAPPPKKKRARDV